jgi:hypothetical protein
MMQFWSHALFTYQSQPMKCLANDYRETVVSAMEDVNIGAIAVWVHVLLILLIYPTQGKFRQWGNGDESVVKLDFKNVDPQNDHFLRFKRETSSGFNVTTDSNMQHRVTSNKFVIPDTNHTQAVVHWFGQGSDVSVYTTYVDIILGKNLMHVVLL